MTQKHHPTQKQGADKPHTAGAKKSRAKSNAKSVPWLRLPKLAHWRSKLCSLLVALVIYFYYQDAVQAEVSLVLPLQVRTAENAIASLLGVREVVLRISGRNLENLRSSDFEAFVRPDANKVGVQNLPVRYRMRSNIPLPQGLALSVKPERVLLRLEQQQRRQLPIAVNISGYPATGFRLDSYQVYPDTVMVTGPPSTLRQLSTIGTEPVVMAGKDGPFVELVNLKAPLLPGKTEPAPNLHLGFAQVQVEVQIAARSKVQTFAIRPQIAGLPAGLRLRNIIPDSIQVTLQGSSEVMQQLENGEQTVAIKLDGGDIFAPGRYSLPVVVGELPTGLTLLNSSPSRISVVIEES